MSKHIVRIGKFADNNVVEWTNHEWKEHLLASHSFLEQIVIHNHGNMNTSPNNPTWYYPGAWSIDSIKNDGEMRIVCDTGFKNTQWKVIHDLRDVQEQMEKMVEILDMCQNPVYWGVLCEDVTPVSATLKICVAAHLACQKCGAVMTPSSLRRHVDSPGCRTRAGNLANGSKNWVRIYDTTILKAVQDAGIEHETRPVAYATWAPRWVADAAKKYKAGKGFAGMSMKDYLQKIKGE